MKIIKKTKQFVKENKRIIIESVCCGVGAATIFWFGYRSGELNVIKWIDKKMGIDIRKPLDYYDNHTTLRELGFDEDGMRRLQSHEYDSLDENVNLLSILQKEKV